MQGVGMLKKLVGRMRIFLTVIMLTVFAAGEIKAGADFTNSEAFKIILAVYFVAMMICTFFQMALRRRQE